MSRKRSDGRKEAKYTLNGKRYSIYGATRAERDEKWEEKKKEIERKAYKKSKDLNMAEYLERWLSSRESVVKPSTLHTYRKLIKRMCEAKIYRGQTFGELMLVELETENIRALQNSLLKELHSRSVNDMLSLLKKALTSACNERIIEWNPSAPIERLKRTEEPARDTIHRCLSREEVARFLEASEETWFNNLFVFLLHSGLRIGEASALSIADVDGEFIHVAKTVVRTEIGYEIEAWTKTEAGRRDVPLLPAARAAWDAQRDVNEKLNGVIDLSRPVFRLPRGGIVRPDRVNTEIRKLCESAGIEPFTCHAFRATFISRCVEDGVPIKHLMEIVGHKDVEMTLALYAHADKKKVRDSLLAVNI